MQLEKTPWTVDGRWGRMLSAVRALGADAGKVVEVARRRGARWPTVSALAESSLWALALVRGSAATRALLGTSLGLPTVLRVVFHIDVWTDAIGPGLRLPHPFGIVIGEGVEIGADCTLMHHVTVQRGAGTRVGSGAVIANGVTVLAGSVVGEGAFIGAASVVRGAVPARMVAVGAPARVIRAVRPGE